MAGVEMKHKHAEVLIAIAEGKDVEWKVKGDDEWHIAQFLPYTPITNSDFEWRIKPEPKPDVVKTYMVHGEDDIVDSIYTANLKLTFDGETGELKSAEVLK
jgi:hypothetical protein